MITIEEARVILGEEMSAKFTDEELQQVIWDFEAIARMTLRDIKDRRVTASGTIAGNT